MNARRIREKKRHREEIITAAEKVFFRKGYGNTTLDEIGKVAEFSRRTLYTYFKSKDDLYLAVHLRYNRMKIDAMERDMAPAETGMAKLRAFGESYYKFFDTYPEYLRFQLYMDVQGLDFTQVQEETLKDFMAMNEQGVCLMQQAFELGQKDGTIRQEEKAEVFITYLFYTLRTIANISLLHAKHCQIFEAEICHPKEFYDQYLNKLLAMISVS